MLWCLCSLQGIDRLTTLIWLSYRSHTNCQKFNCRTGSTESCYIKNINFLAFLKIFYIAIEGSLLVISLELLLLVYRFFVSFFSSFFHLIINFFLCHAMISILGIDLNRSPLNLALHRQWSHIKIENLQRGVIRGYKSYFLILNRYFQVPPNYLSLNNAKSTRVLDCGRQLVYSRPRSSPSRVRVGVEAWSSIRLQSKKYFITEFRWKSEFICANFIKYRKRKSSTKPR